VQQAQYFDTLSAIEPVHNNQWGSADYQLTRSRHAPSPPHFWMLNQHGYLAFEFLVLAYGCERVVFCDVVKWLKPVAVGRRQPVDDQSALGLRVVLKNRQINWQPDRYERR